MYPETIVIPIREELAALGVEELRTAEGVDRVVQEPKGSVLAVVNSICGCAGGRMRPALRMALQHPVRPDRVVSVFAGEDKEATERMRAYFAGYPPSSPSLGLFVNGGLVFFMQRGDIESRHPDEIAKHLTAAFERFCNQAATAD